jgi:hypothetical protein
MEENRIPKRVLYMNLESTRPRGRPRNRWKVREDGRMMESSDRRKYITERKGRSSCERQRMFAFCTCQWNKCDQFIKQPTGVPITTEQCVIRTDKLIKKRFLRSGSEGDVS